jgi:type II secretory pathway pseudopilin PulG
MGERRTTASLAFTLAEVVISISIIMIVYGSLISAYIMSMYRSEWAGENLSAQAAALKVLEAAQAATYKFQSGVLTDQITNINLLSMTSSKDANNNDVWTGYTTNVLDLPISGTNVVWVTNYCTISLVVLPFTSVNYVHMVRVDTVWPFAWYGKQYLYTNSIADYMSPDYQ